MKQKVMDTLACSSIAWLVFIMVMVLHFAA